MVRNRLSYLSYGIIGLGILGLGVQLFRNPFSIFKSIFFAILVGGIIFACIYFLINLQRNSSGDMKKYRQAVKQSKIKYTQYDRQSHRFHHKRPKLSGRKPLNKKASHLRVIEGNRSKRKNRLTF